ncbi:acyl-CoA carboxylase subunit epsilon [Nocardioides sp. SYSU DS0663]|uniref:acyl-CoA carboxylase subunit epsilon n=1 Tax=Nocardioides sp. SYSU DS0663 TaxID=3416445 RepID=UPI003F4C0B1A
MAEEQPDTAAPEQRPLLRVVSPHATPEEVAALVAVLSALGGAEAPPAKPRPEWNAPHRGVRRPLAPGAAAWRASSLPR